MRSATLRKMQDEWALMQLGCVSRVPTLTPRQQRNTYTDQQKNWMTDAVNAVVMSDTIAVWAPQRTTHTSGHVGKYFQRLLMLAIHSRYTFQYDWNDFHKNCCRECNKDVQMKLYYNVTGQSYGSLHDVATKHTPSITFPHCQDGGHLMLQSSKFTEL